jgi:hypothetical protein
MWRQQFVLQELLLGKVVYKPMREMHAFQGLRVVATQIASKIRLTCPLLVLLSRVSAL